MVSSIRITTIFVILVIELLSVQNVNSFTATSSTTAATAARGRTVTANSGKLHRDCGSRSSNNGKSRLSMIRQHRRLIGQSALYAWGKDKELVTPPSTSNTMTTTPLFDDDGTGAAGVAAVVPTSDTEDNEDEAYKSAITKTLAWVAASAAFGTGLFFLSSPQTSEEFFAGYLLEQSLSVDNLLVFLLLFEYFKVPKAYQNRVLNWGIIGAIVMRAIMIGAGAVALQQFHAVLLVFAAILIYSSGKVLLGAGEDDDDEEEDLSQNAIVQFSNKLIASTDQFDGDRFFTFVDGVKMATPMLLCMVAVEFSDVVFAVDSIPAVFGVTEVSSLRKLQKKKPRTEMKRAEISSEENE